MSRLTAVSPSTATGKARELLDSVQQKLGMVPNMMREMAQSPAVLQGYLQLNQSLSSGQFNAKVREQLALAISQANDCGYCLAAHSAIGGMVGLTANQVRDSRLGTAVDPKVDVLLQFARAVADQKGNVSDAELAAVRAAGYGDAAIAEVVGHVALNVLTNYFNNLAQTEIDFPKAEALSHEASRVA